MIEKPPHPIKRRNVILLTGATILLVSILLEPAIPSLFTTQLGALRIVLALVGGVVFAAATTYVGEMALRSPIEPWYARPGAAFLLTVMSCGSIMMYMAQQDIFPTRQETITPEIMAQLFASIGLGLILITVFNWVHYDR
jgi:hypothetical protein